jgi:hypothetical protein
VQYYPLEDIPNAPDMTSDRPQLMILVAGPYRSGTGEVPGCAAARS